jgi:toxin ParE1/3/4
LPIESGNPLRCSPTLQTLGDLGRVDGTRELVVSRTPYILLYRLRGSRVTIVRVFCGARRWPAQFD